MISFKPAEIRVIVALSILLLAGSILNLLKREGKIADLNLAIFSEKNYYNYEHKTGHNKAIVESDSALVAADESSNPAPHKNLNLNTAGYYDLQTLPGIGPSMAERIIAFRDSAGDFRRPEDIMLVKGIGPAKFERMREMVRVR